MVALSPEKPPSHLHPTPIDGRKPPEVSRDVDQLSLRRSQSCWLLRLTSGLQTPDNPSLLLILGRFAMHPRGHSSGCWVLNPLLVLGFHSQPSGLKENFPTTTEGTGAERGFQSGFWKRCGVTVGRPPGQWGQTTGVTAQGGSGDSTRGRMGS